MKRKSKRGEAGGNGQIHYLAVCIAFNRADDAEFSALVDAELWIAAGLYETLDERRRGIVADALQRRTLEIDRERQSNETFGPCPRRFPVRR